MLDRSKCKEMWVWDSDRKKKVKRIVLDTIEDGSCMAVGETHNKSFFNNGGYSVVYYSHYEEIKEPTKRPMTREEVLAFIEYNHILIRSSDEDTPRSKGFYELNCDMSEYQYATITEDGKIGDWEKFEVKE